MAARFTVLFDRDAEADFAHIREHIAAARGREFAEAFIERLISYCEGFASLPHRGALRDEISPGLRTLGWRKTVTIAFRVHDEVAQIVILGVFYRGRDVLAALRARVDE